MKQPAPLPPAPQRTAPPVAEALKGASLQRPGFLRQMLDGLGACLEKGGPIKMA